ncbi:hypothetical protein, partial [Pseudomonas sp. UME83]|uniref:hypothetical protein n=1 Tax=Pseudomonas sp. UME83 TaxID=1862318 RepID=UPI001C803CE8
LRYRRSPSSPHVPPNYPHGEDGQGYRSSATAKTLKKFFSLPRAITTAEKRLFCHRACNPLAIKSTPPLHAIHDCKLHETP